MADVLVTGAGGFIGYHLVRQLAAQGDDVACLIRKSPPRDAGGLSRVKIVAGDITDPESLRAAVAGKSVVYHLAGATRALCASQLDRIAARSIPRRRAAKAAISAGHPREQGLGTRYSTLPVQL